MGIKPLQGLRVLELPGEVATRYCGRLLAQFGADVFVAGHTSDDARIGHGGEAGVMYGRWLDDGKRLRDGDDDPSPDLPFDIVVCGQDAAAIAAAQPLIDSLAGEPVTVAIRWFSADGPYAGWPGNDEVVLALAGLAYAFAEPTGVPTLAQGHIPQLLAGLNACGAALAATLADPASRPRRVDVEVFESTMCLGEPAAVTNVAYPEVVTLRNGVNRFTPTYPATSYRTSDGWIGVTCLTPAQWREMCAAVDRSDLADDPDYASTLQRLFKGDVVDEALTPVIAQRTTAEWVAEGDRRRIPITPMRTPAALLDEPHWRDRGCFAAFGPGAPDGSDVLGPTSPYLGDLDGVTSPGWTADPGVAGPLSGLRVVDFTMGWAGPYAARTLGDLGADVIKIESVTHPDWWRGWEAPVESDPPMIELQPHFNAVSRNKRGIALDLQSAEGKGHAMALIEMADVVIDNYAAGVLEKLGLGPEAQRRLRPGVVSMSMPAFGTTGPLSGLRAYGTTVEQTSGLPFVNGCEEWKPCLSHGALGDPICGVYAATGMLAALVGVRRFGGAQIEMAQVPCLFQLGADAMIATQLSGAAVPRTGNRRARFAPCCVVATANPVEWLAVIVDSDTAWTGLCDVLGADSWRSDAELATVAGRNRRADEIEDVIAAWAAERSAEDAGECLRARNVPAAKVQPAHSLGHDPHLTATGFWQELVREHVGWHIAAAPAYRFDGERPPARRPAPILGEHTAEVLAELAALRR